jgi:hypothetical protein
MTVSLLKTTANNVNGNYAPNCLLNGYFVLNMSGDTHLVEPTNIADGQLFSAKVVFDGVHSLDFSSAYLNGGGGNGSGMFYGALTSSGDYWEGVFFWDGNKALLLSSVQKEF